ncbi:hypothetical protein [Nocardia nova]
MPTMTAAQQRFTYSPADSVWDASQVRGLMRPDGQGERGRGDYGVDGYRVLACTLREAKAAARWLAANNVAPKED